MESKIAAKTDNSKEISAAIQTEIQRLDSIDKWLSEERANRVTLVIGKSDPNQADKPDTKVLTQDDLNKTNLQF